MISIGMAKRIFLALTLTVAAAISATVFQCAQEARQ